MQLTLYVAHWLVATMKSNPSLFLAFWFWYLAICRCRPHEIFHLCIASFFDFSSFLHSDSTQLTCLLFCRAFILSVNSKLHPSLILQLLGYRGVTKAAAHLSTVWSVQIKTGLTISHCLIVQLIDVRVACEFSTESLLKKSLFKVLLILLPMSCSTFICLRHGLFHSFLFPCPFNKWLEYWHSAAGITQHFSVPMSTQTHTNTRIQHRVDWLCYVQCSTVSGRYFSLLANVLTWISG